MSKIIVSGSLAYDRIMDFAGLFSEHFMPDKRHEIDLSFPISKLSVQFGGTAGNIAYNLAQLGEMPKIIATAGNDFGSYRSHLLLAGIDSTSVRILAEGMTASAYMFTDKADNQISAFYGGAGDTPYDDLIDTEGAGIAIIAAGCIADMQALPAYYKKHGLRYLYDPAQQINALSPEDLKEGINGCQVLFGTDHEYANIKTRTGWTEQEILEQAATVVVTYGAKGSDVIAKTGMVHIDACPAQAVIDPTGAGDAHRAGFIKGMVTGFPLEICAKLASAVASYAVETYGTQAHHFTIENIKDRYKKNYHEALPM